MRVEKEATNKVGLIITIIAIVALVVGGGYYLITHKDSLNIDWNIKLPWADDDDSDDKTKEIDSAGKSTTKNKNKKFKDPKAITTSWFTSLMYNAVRITGLQTTDSEIIIKMIYTSIEDGQTNFQLRTNSEIEIYRCVTEGFEVPCKTSAVVYYGTKTEFELHVPKFELRNLELEGITSLCIYYREYNLATENDQFSGFEMINFSNNDAVNNNKTLLLLYTLKIDDFNTVNLKYYKTVTDKANTYIYFVAESKTSIYDITVKPKRILINDKLFKPEKVEAVIYPNASKMFFITIPKTEFKKIEKFNISFFVIGDRISEKNTNYSEQVFLISNEYTREL